MKIAVTYDNEQIFQHFGHTEQVKYNKWSVNEKQNQSGQKFNGSLFVDESGHLLF